MLMACFNKSPWTLVKHPVCDINHFSRQKATLQYYPHHDLNQETDYLSATDSVAHF